MDDRLQITVLIVSYDKRHATALPIGSSWRGTLPYVQIETFAHRTIWGGRNRGRCRNLTDGEPEFGAATPTGQGASPQRSHSRGTEPIWPTEVLLLDHGQSGKQQVRYLPAAKLIWGSDLELDNTVLLRTNVKAP